MPAYGTRRVRNGGATRIKRVPRYVNKREFIGFDIVATEVPGTNGLYVKTKWD